MTDRIVSAGDAVKRRRKALMVLNAHGLYPVTDQQFTLEVLEALAAVLTEHDTKEA